MCSGNVTIYSSLICQNYLLGLEMGAKERLMLRRSVSAGKVKETSVIKGGPEWVRVKSIVCVTRLTSPRKTAAVSSIIKLLLGGALVGEILLNNGKNDTAP